MTSLGRDPRGASLALLSPWCGLAVPGRDDGVDEGADHDAPQRVERYVRDPRQHADTLDLEAEYVPVHCGQEGRADQEDDQKNEPWGLSHVTSYGGRKHREYCI